MMDCDTTGWRTLASHCFRLPAGLKQLRISAINRDARLADYNLKVQTPKDRAQPGLDKIA